MDFKFLPFLTLWTIIVIFLLYKSLSLPTFDNPEDVQEFNSVAEKQLQEVTRDREAENQLLTHRSPPSLQLDKDQLHNKSPAILKDPIHLSQSLLTTKKSTNDYLRQGKVFILIIQNEDLRLNRNSPSSSLNRFKNRDLDPPSPSSSSTQTSNYNVNLHRLVIPAHIRLVISILEAHRIEYVIDSTRRGLPTLLLADQDNISENKLYSVLIIDDFIKYTKLNRWVRDQLDRHCRTNQLGVIAYLTNRKLESQTAEYHQRQRKVSGSTEESLSEQFPLTFKSIYQDQHSCTRNFSTTSSECLVDHQLNELSPVLRILKRRPNFLVKGPLASNLNQSPWISMSSNHITYEPLTWAQMHQNEDGVNHQPSHELKFEQNQSSGLLTGSVNKYKKDQNSLTSQRDMSNYTYAVQPSEYSVQESELQIASVDQKQQKQRHQQRTQSSSMSSNASFSMHETSSFFSDRYLNRELKILSMYDHGLYDGIKRVLFGGANHIWLNRILLLDAIEHLSAGRIISPLERYIQIDIDDIFVGEKGKRMNRSDVFALVEAQREFANRIEGGFKFNLGYSGKYFKHGTKVENAGDEQLIINAQEFTWFCHTWSHSKAHLHNETESIALELKKNMNFAKSHSLPIIGQAKVTSAGLPTYAVAPHHSGVYPIHEQLYDAWRQVLNVQVTSTEEYPALRPASGRRAFVHKAIKVLPRQTCGLYTHTIYKDRYPGGFAKLEATIRGGELFESVLHNPVNIYMTHMSNYANDRLALYTFSDLLDFIQSNTNLQLTYAPTTENQFGPAKLADYYFTLHPHESEPVWTNPCSDRRHLAIWSAQKHHYCNIVPKLLIVGPQKTGTTALYTFLKLNPQFKSSSQQSSADFEEIQFFNDKHYRKGIDWYFQRFSTNSVNKKPRHALSYILNSLNDYDADDGGVDADENYSYNYTDSQTIYFEKSATYFDDPKVPERAYSLLPEAKIVILLVDPGERAYSWYQHMKAHGDATAKTFSFEQVIMAGEDQLSHKPSLKALRNRCLHPGYYSQHLSKWLDVYPSKQIIIIDGLWFKQNPVSVMNRLQLILRLHQPLDYSRLLVFNSDKGFFCARDSKSGSEDRSRCLGSGKGRKYRPMSLEARLFLNHHYLGHNRQLARVLSDIGQPLPAWLDEAVSIVSSITLY